MGTKTKLGIGLGVAALTFAGLAAAYDMTNGDCMAKLEARAIGGTSPVTGFVLHRQWADSHTKGDGLDIRVEVPVPAKVPGLANLEQAMKTTLLVTMAHGKTVYAECTADLNTAITQKGKLAYAMLVRSNGPALGWRGGMCDIDPWTHGIQPGVPNAYENDLVRAYLLFGDQRTMLTEGWIHLL